MADPLPPDPQASVAPLPVPAEREAVVARLSSAFADDVLSMDEFDQRMTAAYRVATRAELAGLVADLPAPAPQPVPEARSGKRGGKRIAARQGSEGMQRLRVLFGSMERGGPRDMPESLEIRARFGNVELDLRASRFRAGVTEIVVGAFCGNIEIMLPAGVTVENHVSAFLASVDGRDGSPSGHAATSVVRIVGRAVLSSVRVDVTPDPARMLE